MFQFQKNEILLYVCTGRCNTNVLCFSVVYLNVYLLGSGTTSQEEEVQLTYMPSNSETSTFQTFAAKAAAD